MELTHLFRLSIVIDGLIFTILLSLHNDKAIYCCLFLFVLFAPPTTICRINNFIPFIQGPTKHTSPYICIWTGSHWCGGYFRMDVLLAEDSGFMDCFMLCSYFMFSCSFYFMFVPGQMHWAMQRRGNFKRKKELNLKSLQNWWCASKFYTDWWINPFVVRTVYTCLTH
jgi:hypothetical protein